MSPAPDLGPVAAAGRKVGQEYRMLLNNPDSAETAVFYLIVALFADVAQGGRFDFQRRGSFLSRLTSFLPFLSPLIGFVQMPQFAHVSNFNVGLHCQQASFPMKARIRLMSRIALWCCVSLLPFGCVYGCIDSACIRQTQTRIHNLAGYDFQAVDVDCDTLAKETWVNIYVSKSNRWWPTKKLVFQYDYWSYEDAPPTIRISGANSYDMAIPKVSEVFCETKRWKRLVFSYHIGYVEFPRASIERC